MGWGKVDGVMDNKVVWVSYDFYPLKHPLRLAAINIPITNDVPETPMVDFRM